METGLTRNRIIAELSKSTHGSLAEYLPVGVQAVKEQPQFFAHLIAWDHVKGQVRNAKVALPILSLAVKGYPEEFVENSLAHLMRLGPREMLQALQFALGLRDGQVVEIVKREDAKGHVIKEKKLRSVPVSPQRSMGQLTRVLALSLLEREKNWPRWERTMLQHRAVLKELFALLHLKPRDQRTTACLHRRDKINGKRVHLPYPEGGLFETVTRLKDMSAKEAAGTIMTKKIPFLIALGALSEKAKETDLVLALIQSMTATELTTNVKLLERLGVKTNAALRGAFQEALEKAGKSKANLLKATTAAEAMDDEDLKASLQGLQEKQIKLSGVEGDWLVLGDRSPSMEHSVEIAKEVAATLTALVKGNVTLTFFDSTPQAVDVTGATLDMIKKATQHIKAGGNGTSIGCGLARAHEYKTVVDGIAIVSDGEENSTPFFADAYVKYSQFVSKEVPVYLFLTKGGIPNLIDRMQQAHLDMQVFDLRGSKPDYYSLPNLVQTMRTNRYSLIDEILETRLLQLPHHFKHGTAKTVGA
jgi:hypothetical protein